MKDLLHKSIFLTLIVTIYSAKFDYYWKDFDGEIPKDAVPGGSDKNNKPTYIAQVYVENNGVLPTRLYEGQKTVTTSRFGVDTSDKFIKILCSDKPEQLSWVPTNASNFHIDNMEKHLVVGGTENGKILNIGRASYEGETIVGKVCGYNLGNALLYFPYNENEISTTTYEILVYEPPSGFDVRSHITVE